MESFRLSLMPISLFSLCRKPRSKAVSATTMAKKASQNQAGVPSQSAKRNSMGYAPLDQRQRSIGEIRCQPWGRGEPDRHAHRIVRCGPTSSDEKSAPERSEEGRGGKRGYRT